MSKRTRRIGSKRQELVQKSREAALAAVQVFNNPLITFKSEMFIVNMHIAWTYLLHAHYREKKVEYRYVKSVGPSGRKTFDTTKSGAHKYWALEDCLNYEDCPVEKDAANNLRFLIGLRHEIEHQMTTRIDDYLSARFQACCLNFNEYIKKLFGDVNGIDKHLAFSLQFSSLSDEQTHTMDELKNSLPAHIGKYIEGFDGELSEDEFDSTRFAYRVIFIPKTVNHRGQADKVIEFVKPDSEIAKGINQTYAMIREKEKQKYRPSRIVSIIQGEGFTNFKINDHSNLWQRQDAKNPNKGYGIQIENQWYWYDSWLEFVRDHCKKNRNKYA